MGKRPEADSDDPNKPVSITELPRILLIRRLWNSLTHDQQHQFFLEMTLDENIELIDALPPPPAEEIARAREAGDRILRKELLRQTPNQQGS